MSSHRAAFQLETALLGCPHVSLLMKVKIIDQDTVIVENDGSYHLWKGCYRLAGLTSTVLS